MSKHDLDSFKNAYGQSFAYDFDNRLILNWYPQRILQRAQEGALLELGLGHGFTTALFSERFSRHVVLDGSLAVITQFKSGYPDCRADVVETYFEDFTTEERFDVIVMGFVLEHVNDPLTLLQKYSEFLKPEGQLFIAVPNAEALNKRVGLAAGLLDDIGRLSEGDLELGHLRLFTVESLRRLVNEAGYVVVHLEGIFLKPLTTKQLQQLELSDQILQGFLQVGIDYPELCVGLLLEATL